MGTTIPTTQWYLDMSADNMGGDNARLWFQGNIYTQPLEPSNGI